MFIPAPMHHQLGCPQFDMGNLGFRPSKTRCLPIGSTYPPAMLQDQSFARLPSGSHVVYQNEVNKEAARVVVALLRDLVKQEGKSLIVMAHDERLANLGDQRLDIRDG